MKFLGVSNPQRAQQRKEFKERPELAQLLPGGADYLAAEALYATSHEGALHLDDILTRRTRISIETFDRGLEAAPQVAGLMREVLDWNQATFDREVEPYAARVAAERDSQQPPDDRTADAARIGAEDVRMGGAGATRLEVVRAAPIPGASSMGHFLHRACL